MTDYAELNRILPRLSHAHATAAFSDEVAPLLVDLWADDYVRRVASCELLETSGIRISWVMNCAMRQNSISRRVFLGHTILIVPRFTISSKSSGPKPRFDFVKSEM
ncbi:hypothetical protein HDG32_000428 [Paraburkholderia sp. CI2]|uniref:hypothetical protein n=1 Tax=Paraburkholderia sp. CI2 TaxID=2723093 RepID=UPI00161AFE40|nr:hypothetical protein [Paraburkholderia sp. CI2]MBB5464335.1 hypothetical protein [Paraburkholderia sp. CI2]